MSGRVGTRKNAQVGVKDKLWMTFHLLKLPVVLPLKILFSPLYQHNRAKTWKRVIGDLFTRYMTSGLAWNQSQSALGTDDVAVYKATTEPLKEPVTVDDIGEGGSLMWVGPKRTDKVILYFHGGAYLLPAQPPLFLFFRYVKEQLKKKGADAGIALLGYSLAPEYPFPTQLKQAVAAVNYLISSGVAPENIQLSGESAGGNLVLQVLSHILHPHPDVPRVSLPPNSRFGPVYLMSPWTDLLGDGVKSFDENSGYDMFTKEALKTWGKVVLEGVPEEYRLTFAEPTKAPNGWFAGIDKLTNRILVSVGGKECLRDTGLVLYEDQLKPHHPHVRFVEQKWGIHIDPFLDFGLPFGLGEENWKGELTPLIVDWFQSGVEEA